MNRRKIDSKRKITMKKTILGKILKNHSVAMILCCAIPLGLFAILSLTGKLGSWGYLALILLCPALHILMMRGYMSSGHDAMDHAPPSGMVENQQLIKKESASGD
jgi:hypothetical protein